MKGMGLALVLAAELAVRFDSASRAQGAQNPTFRARVDLVQVDVVVVDKDEAPVQGLKRGDFVLRESRPLLAGVERLREPATPGVVPTVTLGDPVRIADVLPLRTLPPGAYMLRVTLGDGGRTATRGVGFPVR